MTEIKISLPISVPEKKGLYLCFYLRLLFHMVSVCIFYLVNGYAGFIWYELITEAVEVDNPKVWAIKWFTPCFVTNWNFLFQTCLLTMCLAYDLMEWIDRHESKSGRRLKYYRDVLFSGIVVPLTMFISSMFWILYWIDRELVFPQVYDQIVPWWFNHCVHTNILIVIGLETLLQERRHPANLKLELSLNGLIGVAYAIVYYSIYFFTNRWLYGVFAIMTWWQVCLYQILIWASTFIFYGIQFPINRLFHKESPKNPEQKTDNQNTEKKTEPTTVSPDSWSLKYRSKGLIENSCL